MAGRKLCTWPPPSHSGRTYFLNDPLTRHLYNRLKIQKIKGGSGEKRIPIVLWHNFYCSKAYREGEGGPKFENLSVCTFWITPNVYCTLHILSFKKLIKKSGHFSIYCILNLWLQFSYYIIILCYRWNKTKGLIRDVSCLFVIYSLVYYTVIHIFL